MLMDKHDTMSILSCDCIDWMQSRLGIDTTYMHRSQRHLLAEMNYSQAPRSSVSV